MLTVSWYAWLALRRRVNMSAIGSVIVMVLGYFLAVVSDSASDLRSTGLLPGNNAGVWGRSAPASCRANEVSESIAYQDDFVMPGSSPLCAISRRQIRHRPNLR